MNPLHIITDIESETSLLGAINELLVNHFSHYPKIHELAKQNQKPQAIDLTFGNTIDGTFSPVDLKPETALWLDEILALIPKRGRLVPDESTKSEIAFFAEACQYNDLRPAIKKWINRLASYNFGTYSATMLYNDNTPVGFWACVLLVLHHPQEMETLINYLSSLNMPNLMSKRRNFQDNLLGYEHPTCLAACFYIYQKQGWNERTLKLLCTQIVHYWYIIPEELPALLEKINPKGYLRQDSHLQFFITCFENCAIAHENEHGSGDQDSIAREIFPLMIADDQLEEIKKSYIEP